MLYFLEFILFFNAAAPIQNDCRIIFCQHKKMELIGNIENYITAVNDTNLATHYDFGNSVYYSVVKERYTEFWKYVCESFQKDHDSSGSYSGSDLSTESETDSDGEGDPEFHSEVRPRYQLAEVIRPDQNIPLVLDFNFKFDPAVVQNPLNGLYNNAFVGNLVRECQDEIKKAYRVELESEELIACLIEYPDQHTSGDYLVHFKLHFPYLKVSPSDNIYANISKRIANTSLLTQLKYHPKNQWDTILKGLNKYHLPLLGQENPVPRFALAFKDNGIIEKDKRNLFDPKKHYHYVQQYFNPGSDLLKTDFWLPMFFSIGYGLKHAKKITNETQIGTGNRLQFTFSQHDTDEQGMAKQFLSMLNPERANIHYYWQDVGKALYNVYDGSKRGLKVWRKFTARVSHKFNPKECDKFYEDFENDNYITLRTLGWYARIDSSVLYEDWMKKRIKEAISDAIKENTDFNVGKVFQKMFWLDYVCANVKKKEWYKYEPREHHWIKIDGGSDLRNEISTTFSRQFRIYRQEFLQAIDEAANQRDRENNDILRKNITRIIYDAGNYNKKNVLVQQIADLMRDKHFAEVKDTNTNLIGIRNGVIECFSYEAIFRAGKPEDYVTRSSRVKYDPNMTWKHPSVVKVKRWFRKIYPQGEVYAYVWKIFSSFLQGKNIDKKVYFFTGSTNGGKSMIKKFFESILGQYSFTLSAGALANRKNGNNGLRPDLALAMQSNTAWVLECNEMMNENEIKLWTGNDSVFVRLMGENGGNQTPRFKLLYVCNMVPIVLAGDNAIRERILVVPHESIFSHDAPSSKEEQFKQRIFKRNNNFERKMARLRSAGLWMMLQHFQKYKKEGLTMPAIIQAATESYWDDNDIYGAFINEKIIETESEQPLEMSDLYSKFCEWLRSNYPSIDPVPNINTVKKLFSERFQQKKIGQLEGGRWYGLRIGSVRNHIIQEYN